MASTSYTTGLGASLRRVRQERGWSLHEVERRSDGSFKAAVVGSYERGDRNISASRLCELAAFYGVAPSEVLPGEAAAPSTRDDGLVLDLSRVDELDDRWAGLRSYCQSIQIQRGDFNRQVLSLREDDLRALAVILGTTSQGLVDDLREIDAVR